MEKGMIYTQERPGSIQAVWSQFHYDTKSVVWSDDGGITWIEVPSMDTGKWPLFTIKNGHRIEWIFKVKE
jgi:hypothetical protein